MSGIAGGSEQFSAGESGLVKQRLDCAVRAFIISYIVSCMINVFQFISDMFLLGWRSYLWRI